ncbi:MAG: DUF1540 domain-containing protein [Oscillospiraceae bacterium]|nr:DUF1540 domain-containing protein [Oscillospiraceae bacterium]
MNSSNNNNTNKDKKNHVKCDVCNCVHNDQNCGCTAKQILVGPDFATSQKDTTCASFKKSNS